MSGADCQMDRGIACGDAKTVCSDKNRTEGKEKTQFSGQSTFQLSLKLSPQRWSFGLMCGQTVVVSVSVA